jgi:hypothetical protein
MNDDVATRAVPAWYWIVAGLAVLWEGFGCYIYVTESLARGEAGAMDSYATMASWQWGVFAVAVWSGLIGAIGLLLRKRWAVLALLVSVIAAVIQYGYEAATNTLPGDAMPVAVSVVVIGLLLVAFANYSGRKGWLS